ncbi:glycosyltransferase family 4 protein [Alienimonas californiensis]|uniref:WecA-like glycosyltransferase n=1 Tax=Alienimonas californiensis TaxID=2527989 RepID=A0A517P634_9PLAN|nr:MraY family glycosyltransferase [Alienimonas californiensis]QDT14841.1 WecA-like glycosyltransferase [Alienimonas californiensis]
MPLAPLLPLSPETLPLLFAHVSMAGAFGEPWLDLRVWAVLFGMTVLAAAGAGVVRWIAPRLGAVDAPDGGRKRHRKVTPLWGGIAVVTAFVAGVAAFAALGRTPAGPTAHLWGLTLTAALFCFVGAWDDRRPMRARTKLLGMFLAALPFALLGPSVTQLELSGYVLQFTDWGLWGQVAAAVFVVLWLVGWANVVNLSDGLDGLASGVGWIVAMAIAVHSALVGQWGVTTLALAFSAAVFGFLPHNLPTKRAKIFLGDSGSLAIGACLGMLSLWIESKTFSGVTLVGVLAAGAVSGWDVMTAMARRKLSGQSIAAADRHHLHHRLQDRGLSVRRTLAVILSMTALTAAAGVLGAHWRTPWLAPGVCAALFAGLAAAKVFGHHEAALLGAWAGAAWQRRTEYGIRIVRPSRSGALPLPEAEPVLDASPAAGDPQPVRPRPARRAA